jgi:hypothetical protein
MKNLSRISTAFLAICFALPLWSTLYMISFAQPERAQIKAGELHFMFSYENFVHEAGFARLAISIIALLILFVPYQRGERWAFAALVILTVAYYVPVFLFGAIPNLGTWPAFRSVPQLTSGNLTWYRWSTLSFTLLLALGLAMSAPRFFRRKDL